MSLARRSCSWAGERVRQVHQRFWLWAFQKSMVLSKHGGGSWIMSLNWSIPQCCNLLPNENHPKFNVKRSSFWNHSPSDHQKASRSHHNACRNAEISNTQYPFGNSINTCVEREIQKFISKLSFCVPAGLNDPSFQLLPHHSLGHGTTTGTFGTAGAVRLDSTGLQATVVKEAAEMTASRVGSWRIKGRKSEKNPQKFLEETVLLFYW